jgi:hypothetical protein
MVAAEFFSGIRSAHLSDEDRERVRPEAADQPFQSDLAMGAAHR